MTVETKTQRWFEGWLSTIMRYYTQPVVKRLGIKKRVTWHTFRRTYTTFLHANGKDVKKVRKVVGMMRSEKPAPEAKKA
jgi:site-specific recombinase XerD